MNLKYLTLLASALCFFGQISAQDAQELNRGQMLQKQQIDEESGVQKKGSIFYSDHPAAFHFAYGISWDGSTVEMEDGSIWVMSPYENYKVLNWLIGDNIVVAQNTSIFSSYQYVIHNLDTGNSCPSNLALGPLVNGFYTYWIAAIDYAFGQVMLCDGSWWDVSGFDMSYVNKWLYNDTIIIGCSSAWNNLSYPNILINVNMDHYVRACGI